VNNALSTGAEPGGILVDGLIGGIGIVGKRFSSGEMFLPEVMMCAEAMHQGIDIVKPLLSKADQKTMGNIVLGTVEGDIHDIGKRIVGFFLQGNGYEVVDLGVDVSPDAFVKFVEEHEADVLAMSALLTTTMPKMKETIELLKKKGLREKLKVIVGGAAVTDEFSKSIGADGYASEAGSAAELVKKLLA